MSDTLSLYLHGLVQSLSKVARAVTHTLHCVAKIQSTSHMTQLKPVTAIGTFTFTCKLLLVWSIYTIFGFCVWIHIRVMTLQWDHSLPSPMKSGHLWYCCLNASIWSKYATKQCLMSTRNCHMCPLPPPPPQYNLHIYLYFEHVQPWVWC